MRYLSQVICTGGMRELERDGQRMFETSDGKRFRDFFEATHHLRKIALDKYFRTHANKIRGQGATIYFTKRKREAIDLSILLRELINGLSGNIDSRDEKIRKLESEMEELRHKLVKYETP